MRFWNHLKSKDPGQYITGNEEGKCPDSTPVIDHDRKDKANREVRQLETKGGNAHPQSPQTLGKDLGPQNPSCRRNT